ncbi:MAG: C40 family peptidase [Microgenomates group bacterium]
MLDRRSTAYSGRVAHISLKGVVEAAEFTTGVVQQIGVPVADLLAAPAGARERQLCYGEAFTVLDQQDGYAYGFADKDGYCGWVHDAQLVDYTPPTHWVASPATHSYTQPRVQAPETHLLPMGARVRVAGQSGMFSETELGFIPTVHLLPLGTALNDPVSVAERLLGTPYLWGGNTRSGIDCSGLVQVALLSCGIACPGDSDQQQALGRALLSHEQPGRGDLIFWRGHMGLVVDSDRLIHANGHTMSVAFEWLAPCISRIAQQNGGEVTHIRRLKD